MNINKISWWTPKIGNEEIKFIKQVFDNNFPNEGELTTLFEQKLCKLLDCKYATAVTSGTAAIFLVLKGLGIGYGDEVIVPDITFIATANAVEMCGAKPILVDIDKERMTMSIDNSLNSLSKAITKKTKAIIPVHVSGRAADMEAISEIITDYNSNHNNNIKIVEDAAEALLSKHNGKYLGTFGKAGCFSFSPNKTITTGQGGIIVTDDHDLHIRLRELKDQGRPIRGTGGDDIHNVVGYNFKFTDLQAAVGLGQLNYLETRIGRMKRVHSLYFDYLRDLDDIFLLPFDIEECPQWTDVIIGNEDDSEKRNQLYEYLKNNGIECRKYWLPLHTQKPYKLPDNNFQNSTKLSPKAMWLPSAFTLSDSDIETVCNHIRKFLTKEVVK